MDTPEPVAKKFSDLTNDFSPISSTRIFWNSRKRTASCRSLEKAMEKEAKTTNKKVNKEVIRLDLVHSIPSPLSERRKALFEPLEPTKIANERRLTTEVLLPQPDFDATTYPKGWLIGKKRKLVNVDVVESMRRIAVQEMNRKDREIDGLNEQLEGDARCLEHLQLLQERSKRTEVERENAMLRNQISMLMEMLEEEEAMRQDPRGQEES